jgi:cytochrome c biogenesis protein CcmG, thiol:disulfide interchange protein DsbE
MNAAKIKNLIPFVILFIIFALFLSQLFTPKAHELPSPLIGESIPHFSLPSLYPDTAALTPAVMKGQVALLNVFATWCHACIFEHETLMHIQSVYHIPIYAINYKDDADATKKWLQAHGNPYRLVGMDQTGDIAIDLGVYGTPETFVISREGKIVYRHVGIITQQNWEQVLYPLIKRYEAVP